MNDDGEKGRKRVYVFLRREELMQCATAVPTWSNVRKLPRLEEMRKKKDRRQRVMCPPDIRAFFASSILSFHFLLPLHPTTSPAAPRPPPPTPPTPNPCLVVHTFVVFCALVCSIVINSQSGRQFS
ncbi:hypothetical protein BKA57DRAFT_439324 [Linnemannia elongata]|nr:hypothetical protein BKA57DRAFT_439324 [Linnemannia elongata]